MSRPGGQRVGVFLPAVALLLMSGSAAGQSGWDPDRYVELSQTGQALFLDALDEEPGSDERRVLLIEASGEMKEALFMVRQAISAGEVEAVRGEAQHDFFTLMENLTVVWLTLDACGPAQRLVDVAVSQPDARTEDLALFENLSPRLSACRERANVWVWARYQGLVARSDMRREQAAAGGRADRPLLSQAALASEEALRTYRAALFAGELGAIPFDDAVGELFTRYDTTIGLQLDVADCTGASQSLSSVEADVDRLLGEPDPELTHAAAVPTCVEGQPVEGFEEEAAVASAERLREAAGWALIGAGVVLGGSAIAVAVTADEQQSDGNATLTAALVGGLGVAAAVTGVVLLLTGGEPAEAETGDISLVPVIGPGGVGALVGTHF